MQILWGLFYKHLSAVEDQYDLRQVRIKQVYNL